MFLELPKQLDVLIEIISPGILKRLGLGKKYADVNLGLVYCSIDGYGQTGPYKVLRAHDQEIHVMSGIVDMNSVTDGYPNRIGVCVGDLVTPLYVAYLILGVL